MGFECGWWLDTRPQQYCARASVVFLQHESRRGSIIEKVSFCFVSYIPNSSVLLDTDTASLFVFFFAFLAGSDIELKFSFASRFEKSQQNG